MAAIDQLPTLLQGTYRALSIVYPPPFEELQPTPVTLGTTAPTPQISMTITTDMLPYLDTASAPLLLNTPTYHAHLYAGGHNPTSGRSISYAGYKNGSPTAATFTITAGSGDEWTGIGVFPNVIAGDLLEVYLTSHGGGAEWDYTALVIFIDAVQVADDTHVLGRVEHSLSYYPFLQQGTPVVQAIGPFHASHEGLISASLGVGTKLDALIMTSPDYTGHIHYGGETMASLWYVGASRPMCIQNIAPLGFLFWDTEITTATIATLPDDVQGVAKAFTITYPGAVEALDGTPPDLPTSLPGSPQFSLTLASGNIPTIAPAAPAKYHALIYLAGRNTNALGRTVTCEIWKNGVLFQTASNTAPSMYYWTLNAPVPDVVAGDLLEVFAYASGVNVTWDYQAYAVLVDEIQVAPPDRLLANVGYDLSAYPVLSSGTPLVQDTGAFHVQHLGIMGASLNADATFATQVQRSSMCSGWTHYGHLAHTADVTISSTDRPLYVQNMVPVGVEFILTDVTV